MKLDTAAGRRYVCIKHSGGVILISRSALDAGSNPGGCFSFTST